ncbi:hypothetical protein M1295_00320 [Patescibacteria group bacterium]|nr:hypothetical protein [Patescibacteria group bacterium]
MSNNEDAIKVREKVDSYTKDMFSKVHKMVDSRRDLIERINKFVPNGSFEELSKLCNDLDKIEEKEAKFYHFNLVESKKNIVQIVYERCTDHYNEWARTKVMNIHFDHCEFVIRTCLGMKIYAKNNPLMLCNSLHYAYSSTDNLYELTRLKGMIEDSEKYLRRRDFRKKRENLLKTTECSLRTYYDRHAKSVDKPEALLV